MLVILPSPIPELQHAPLPPKVLRAKERAIIPYSFVVFSLDSHLSPLRNLGVCHHTYANGNLTHGTCDSKSTKQMSLYVSCVLKVKGFYMDPIGVGVYNETNL
jgi:hypothetical protein